MLGSRNRTIVTATVVAEVGLAGWALGDGLLWLLVMVTVVTAVDTAWGVARRRSPADIAGLEVAALLAVLLAVEADGTLALLCAAACAAWLIRPERQEPLTRLTRPPEAPTAR